MAICGYTFHPEHCIPKSVGGASDESNLALACASCNLRKADHTLAVDPATGRQQPVFHPVEQTCSEHFRLVGNVMAGKSAIGRATIALLDLNSRRRQTARAAWRATGWWP